MSVPAGFSSSYDPDDVSFLLKPVGLAPVDIATKERLIQSGAMHYSDLVVEEKPPGAEYLDLYERALRRNASRLRGDILGLASGLGARRSGPVVLVSLARAGVPIGVLLTRELRRQGRKVTHYGVSIVRDRELDRVAINYILRRHPASEIVFVDGWTGKGAIERELRRLSPGLGLDPVLAVVADPAGVADLAATSEDYLIPSGLLNGVVSGLISRSILNSNVVGPSDFHGCLLQDHLRDHDLSAAFIARVEGSAPAEPRLRKWREAERQAQQGRCADLMAEVGARLGVTDPNRIKPGLAEATRAMLRRLPEALLVADKEEPDVAHLVHLAAERGAPVLPLRAGATHRAVALVRGIDVQDAARPLALTSR